MIKNEKGSTLALCIIIMCMLSIFVVGMGTMLTLSRRQKLNEISEERSFYLTDSCIAVTQAALQKKVTEALAQVLMTANDQVPVTYEAAVVDEAGMPTGATATQVFPKSAFVWLYTRQAMAIFSAVDTSAPANTYAHDILQFVSNKSDAEYINDPISEPMLTALLAESNTATKGYTIEVNIEQNTAFGNFGEVFSDCYPSRIDSPLPEDADLEVLPEDFKYLPGKPRSDDYIATAEEGLNTGILRVRYTVRDKDGVIRENVRVAYSFDMYHPVMQVAASQADLIYDRAVEESTGEVKIIEDTQNINLNFKVTREYLPI